MEFNRRSILVLIAAYLGMAAMGVTIQVITPVSNEIRTSLGLTFGELGFLMGVISVPGIFLAVPAGFLADKFGSKRLLLLGALLMALGALIFPLFPNYTLLVSGRFLAGMGCTLVSVLFPGLIPKHFQGKSLGIAMGIYNTALSVGSIVTLTFFHGLSIKMGTFGVFWIAVGISLLLLITAALCLTTEKKADTVKFSLPGNQNLWLLGAVVLFANLASMGYVTIAPSFYELLEIPWSIRGTMLSAVLWGGLFFAPVAGYFTSHHAKGKVFLLCGTVLQGLGLFLIPYLQTPLLFDLILLTIGAGIIMTPVYIFIPKIVARNELNVSFAVMFSAMMIGCLLGPFFVGMIQDRFLSYHMSFLLLSLFSFGAAVFGLLAKEP